MRLQYGVDEGPAAPGRGQKSGAIKNHWYIFAPMRSIAKDAGSLIEKPIQSLHRRLKIVV